MTDVKVEPKIPTKVAQPSIPQKAPVAEAKVIVPANGVASEDLNRDEEITLEDIIASIQPFLIEERTPSNWQFEPSETEGFNLCTNLRTGRQLDIPMSLFNQLLRN
jgi:hypothetical protein